MAGVGIPMSELTRRAQEVGKLLRPFSGGRPIPCTVYNSQVRCGLVPGKAIAAHSGNVTNTPYRDWLFPTLCPSLVCRYHELWRLGKKNRLILHQANLTLLKRNSETHGLDGILCVHCEPLLAGSQHTDNYKRGPHLHVTNAQDPIPGCHFLLTVVGANDRFSSMRKLNKALISAFSLIANEVVPKF